MISIVSDSRLAELKISLDKNADTAKRMEEAANAVKESGQRAVFVNVKPWIEAYGVQALRDLVQGMILADYRQIRFPKKEREPFLAELTGVEQALGQEAQNAVREGEILAQSVCFARDLVNLPANYLRPADFVRRVAEWMEGTGVQIECLDETELKKQGLNALLAVGESSAFPPYLMILRYRNCPESKEVLGLAGKGVTCDTGGYCLKSPSSMTGMKGDMAGGAAVAGAIYALAKNKVRTNVTGLIPLCENRVSPGGLLPGDVITAYGGKTIEVVNTDAEGRLILADAVSYGVHKEKVTRIIDIATLTGAVVRALGFGTAGVLTNDEAMWRTLKSAAQRSGEWFWRLPINREYEKRIESDIADVKNSGGAECSGISLIFDSFASSLSS